MKFLKITPAAFLAFVLVANPLVGKSIDMDFSLCVVCCASHAASIALSYCHVSFFLYLVAAYEVPSDNLIAELADEYDESSSFGLRGSSSNDEELQSATTDVENVDWNKILCEANQRAAVWRRRMGERTGRARENARQHYLEAKAASLRAKAHITPAARDAWDTVKETSRSVARNARNWFDRRFGDGSTQDGDGEDEFDVQC